MTPSAVDVSKEQQQKDVWQNIFNKRGVNPTEEEYREMKDNVRTFFGLLQKWNSELYVTNIQEYSKIRPEIGSGHGGDNNE